MKPVFLQLLLLLCSLNVHAYDHGGSGTSGRDTASAVVVYNADMRFVPQAHHTAAHYEHMLDSLERMDKVPATLINQVSVYLHLSRRNPDELSQVVDSIFELPHVPAPVLSAVNLYLAAAKERMEQPTGFAAYIPEDGSRYPANAFYGDWNTLVPFPDRNDLSRFDSTLTLLLTDNEKNCGFQLPFDGVITSHFGWRYGRNHNGVDIDLEVWDPVRSAFPGVVRVARTYKGYGRVVVIRHYNGLETLYAHLHRFKCAPGDVVEAGQVIGLGGSSGNSTGSHLHFEVRFQGVPVKPSSIIDFKNKKLRSELVHLKKSGAFLAAIPALGDGQAPNFVYHQVRKGDYLYKIAQEYGTTVEKLCELNTLSRNEQLTVGQKLRVGI